MEIVTTIRQMKSLTREARRSGASIGLIPTMGFLHEGHLSLMRRGRSENGYLVVSVFVNPTQFGPNEDLAKYPRDIESDKMKCREVGVDAFFAPTVDEMYRPGFQTEVNVTRVSGPLCGACRPGHFKGVAAVVLKLFNIVGPGSAYFGEKDYQQLQVIKSMVRDLDLDVRIESCPTIREKDGLAMSSRNKYLSADQRKQALCLFGALKEADNLFRERETDIRRYHAVMSGRIMMETDAAIDYARIVEPDTMEDLDIVQDRALAVLAVKIGSTRLIDNMRLDRNPSPPMEDQDAADHA